jgi:hypothetical protein
MAEDKAWPAVLICWRTKAEEALASFADGSIKVRSANRARVYRQIS